MLIFSFCLATLALFLQSISLSPIPIQAYIPWIALVALKDPLQKDAFKLLFLSSVCGLIVDLLSSHPIGLHPIAYSLSAVCLLRFRNRFLIQNPLHFGLCSALTSWISSIFEFFFLFLFDQGVGMSWFFIVIDWISMSIVNFCYAIIWFFAPLYLFAKGKRLYHIHLRH